MPILRISKIINPISFVLLLLSLSNNVYAQPNHLQLNQLTTKDGLSSTSIICMEQDELGFMWIGTNDGLNRFDGYSFKIYKYEESNTNSIPDNLIISMFQNKENELFVGTNAGLSKFDRNFDRFINYKNDTSSCLYDLSFQGRAITEGQNGTLYIATDIGLLLFYPQQNTYEIISSEGNVHSDLSHSVIDDIYLDSKNRLWVGCAEGLNIFQAKNKSFKRITKGKNGEDFSKARFSKLIEDKSGIIWAATSKNGLIAIEETSNGNFSLTNYTHNPNSDGSISHNRLLTLQVDNDNNLWVGA